MDTIEFCKIYKIDKKAFDKMDQNIKLIHVASDLKQTVKLVKEGADITYDNHHAVQNAIQWGAYEVVNYLVSKGANIYSENKALLQLCKKGISRW